MPRIPGLPNLPVSPQVMGLAGMALLGVAAFVFFMPRYDSPAELNRLIEDGAATKALSEIEPMLATDPTNPVAQSLALKAYLYHCAAVVCPTTKPAMLTSITTLAQQVPGQVAIDETITLSTNSMVATSAMRLSAAANHPTPVLALYQTLPDTWKPAAINATFTAALQPLREGERDTALARLQPLAQAQALPEATRYWSMLQAGLLAGNVSNTESAVIALRSQQQNRLPESALRLLPHTLLSQSGDIKTLAATMPATVADWNLPTLLNAEAMAQVAEEADTLRLSPHYLQNLLPGRPRVTLITSSTALTQPDALAQLYLMRLSLALDPRQESLWNEFLPLAVKAANDGNFDILAGPGAPDAPPANLQGEYIATLFRLVEAQAAKGAPLLPLLEQLGSLKLDKTAEVRLEKMVQAGLDNAITQRRIADIAAYAKFRPEVARGHRQNVVPVLVESIRADLAAGRFQSADDIAALMTDTLKIDFNYDALILQEFDAQVKSDAMLASLSGNTPDALMQTPATATVDLGPMWDHLQSHFADNPEMLDQQLKNLIAGARGLYGTPIAMLRLFNHFNNETFPPEARHAYLLSAIQRSLIDDDRLTGAELAETAWSLSRLHEGLSLAPLLEEALRRADTLEESRTLWQQSAGPVRQTITVVRPQFAALMRGIDAWVANRRTQAANEFAQLGGATAVQYAQQIAPYLEGLRETLITLSGTYAPENPTAALPAGLLMVEAPALAGKGRITGVQLTALSKPGATPFVDPTSFSTSHGHVQKVTLSLPVDFDSLKLTVPATAKAASGKAVPFAPNFGDITTLSWSANGETLTVEARNMPPTRFKRLRADATATLVPQGDYVVGKQVSEANAATDLILPPGSLFTITTDANPSAFVTAEGEHLGNAYQFTGTLRHPAMAKPQEIKGYYEADKHTLNFTFTPPLSKGGVARAAVRCQVMGAALLCGAHHTHSNRQQFTHRVTVVQTKESAQRQAATWAEANQRTHSYWRTAEASRLLDATSSAAQPEKTGQPSESFSGLLFKPKAETSPTIAVSATSTVTPSLAGSVTTPTIPARPGTPAAAAPQAAPTAAGGNGTLLPPPEFMSE